MNLTKSKPLVTILVPTFNNTEYLNPCLNSVVKYATPQLFQVLVVNNGHPRSCDWIQHKTIKVLNAPSNLGWEGGIDFGLKNSESELVVFMNDDTLVPDASSFWLHKMAQLFRDPKVGAVGPSSNVVMGLQNIFTSVPYSTFQVSYIIGFCAMIRRKAFEQIGGMDMNLKGGDDLDWSIRLRDAGYKILVDRNVFVFHHGFKTGTRTMGDQNTVNGWNSYEMTERTNLGLIKKHGLKKWFYTLYQQLVTKTGPMEEIEDAEGVLIRKLIKKDKAIFDIGCGPRKTLPKAIGVDFIKGGEEIPSLGGGISQADLQADVSKSIPVKENTVDVIIARHILEHMIDPVSVLEMWISKLRVGGRLIIAVPNQEIINSIPMNLEHVHAYTPQSLAVLLRSFGMTNVIYHEPNNHISFVMEGTKV